MAVSFVGARAAYQAVQRIGAGAAGETSAAPAAQTPGAKTFESTLNDALRDAVKTMRVGETAAAQGAAGQGDIVNVVNAVTAAELTLETVVAIRDRVISAYQDIMKMPI